MDAEYWDRQAATARKKVEQHLRDRGKHEEAANKADTAAAKAQESASRSKSASIVNSKLKEAERKRKAARDAREKATKAGTAATAAQKKVNEHEGKAAAERTKGAKKAEELRKRHEREEAARRRREEQERARIERARDSEVEALKDRTLELQEQLGAAQLAAPKKITVLLMAGTPEGGEQPLRLDREIREIKQKLRSSEYRDQIEFKTTEATQVADILDALNEHDPTVVHFSGHGSRSSLLFEDRDGEPHALSGDQLAMLLQAARTRIGLLIFNACESADQALFATDFVDAAIGMDASIGDEAAKVFAGQFYGALASGCSVQVAFDQAKAQTVVLAGGSGEPRLEVREGIEPETMVLIAP